MAVAEKAPKMIDVKAAEAPWYRRWLPLIGVALIVLYCLAAVLLDGGVVASAADRPVREHDHSVAYFTAPTSQTCSSPAPGSSVLC